MTSTTIISKIKENPTVLRVGVEQEYDVIQLTPDDRIKEKDYAEIMNIMYSVKKDFEKRKEFKDGCLDILKQQAISYEILFNGKENITFNFAVVKSDSQYVKNRIQGVFCNSTILYRSDYRNEFVGAYLYEYNYEKRFICSLDTAKDKDIITNILAMKKDIKETDKMLIQVCMLPIDPDWKCKHEDLYKEMKRGNDATGNTSPIIKIFDKALKIVDSGMGIMDDVIGMQIEKHQEDIDKQRGCKLIESLSSESRQKTKYDGFKVAIKVFVKTDNEIMAYSLAKGVETAYKDLAKDNSLIMTTSKKIAKEKHLQRKVGISNKNIMSSAELSQIIRIPDRVVQRRYKLPSIKVNQVSAPTECLEGKIRIGDLTKHGKSYKVYFPHLKDIMCLPKVLLTKMGGGKTTYILNVCHDIIECGQSLILIDYIQDNKTARALKEMYPNAVYIDLSIDRMPMHFPEKAITDDMTPQERKKVANAIAYEVKFLFESLGKETYTTFMEKYLKSASKIVFIHKYGSIKNVIDVIENHIIRKRFIDMAIESGCFTEESSEIVILKQLDEYDKKGNVVGTVENKQTDGLATRFYTLTGDTTCEEMLDIVPDDNCINFKTIMDSGKPLIIAMKQEDFTVSTVRDLFVTYFMSRIRLAMSTRSNPDKVAHIILDEVHQVKGAMELIQSTIGEPRKFGVSYWLAMHSLDQLPSSLRDLIIEVGCHFMLLKGVSKKGYDSIGDYIGEDFTYEDIVEMEYDFGSMNVISVKNRYHTFISKLPDALRNSNGKLYIE